MKYKKEILVGLLIFAVLYPVVILLVGIAAAAPTPAGYFDWYRSNDLIWLGLFIWNLCTIYPASALPSLIITFVGIKISAAKWLPVSCVVTVLYLGETIYREISFALQFPQYAELISYKTYISVWVLPAFVFLGGFLTTKYFTKNSTRTQ
ncbi:hypothetical protein [Arsukibacterium perlucidum]|uniref:hypothetical protein n=1 Tax=Arsukibacterium perlucidum TaxID=368811 RepID=UPI0003778206|nr:hypothetical protein [Arsukibacterium perlucidum]